MPGRFEFALMHAEGSQWHAFERLARAFMAADYREMRTLASATGDGGRDGMLYASDDDPSTAIQMSMAQDWGRKIKQTQKRLDERHSGITNLIYLTNQQIGPLADDLSRSMRRDHKLSVDVRDRSWFVDRENLSVTTRAASDNFSRSVADPILTKAEIFDRGNELLSNQESRVALLYLVLQAEDDATDRQLTKLCFDSLVRTALRRTDNEHRMSRDEVYAWVLSVLPTHVDSEVQTYVDRALERLDKNYVRHWRKEDMFCLNYDERVRLAEKVVALTGADAAFDAEMLTHARFVVHGMDVHCDEEALVGVVERARRVLEQFLFERGEAFVESVRTGQAMLFSQTEIADIAKRDAVTHPDLTTLRHNLAAVVAETVERAVLNLSDQSQVFLRAIGDAYTLFAFLCETPNVQSAVSKLFSTGEFWLDTSAVLPLLAEELLDEPERRNTILVKAMLEAGAQVHVTYGVVEELLHHIDTSMRAWRRPADWRGRTPFLYSAYLWSGSPNDRFSAWLENFRGQRRPDTDMAEYLKDVHGIRVGSLKAQAEAVDDELRWRTHEYWMSVHLNRNQHQPIDPDVAKQLAERDVENFLGVLHMRGGGEEVGNYFGYRHWWLSLTRSAVAAADKIRSEIGLTRLDSPVLSYDFLAYYLTVGPARRQLSKSLEQRLPMMMDTSLLDASPSVLLDIADGVRRDLEGQDDRVIRRMIRDRLDQEKLSGKRVGKAGMDAIVDDLRAALEAKAARSEA